MEEEEGVDCFLPTLRHPAEQRSPAWLEEHPPPKPRYLLLHFLAGMEGEEAATVVLLLLLLLVAVFFASPLLRASRRRRRRDDRDVRDDDHRAYRWDSAKSPLPDHTSAVLSLHLVAQRSPVESHPAATLVDCLEGLERATREITSTKLIYFSASFSVVSSTNTERERGGGGEKRAAVSYRWDCSSCLDVVDYSRHFHRRWVVAVVVDPVLPVELVERAELLVALCLDLVERLERVRSRLAGPVRAERWIRRPVSPARDS